MQESQDPQAELLLNKIFGIDRLAQAATKPAWETGHIINHTGYAQADRRCFEVVHDDGSECLWIYTTSTTGISGTHIDHYTLHWHHGQRMARTSKSESSFSIFISGS